MKATDKTDTIILIATVLLVLLWGYTAFAKLVEYHKFVFQMKLAPVPLMQAAAPVIGWLVPLVELAIVALLIGGIYINQLRFKGLYASFFLLLSFQVYITAMLLSGLDLPCTCGGFVSGMSWKTHLLFNGTFMLIAIFPIIYNNRIITRITMNIRHMVWE